MEREQRVWSYDIDDVICAAVQGDLDLLNLILAKENNTWNRDFRETAMRYAAKMGHMHILGMFPLKMVYTCSAQYLAQETSLKKSMCNAARDGNIKVLDWFAGQLEANNLSVTHVIKSTHGEIIAEAAKNNQIQILKWFEKYLEDESEKISGFKVSMAMYGAVRGSVRDIARNNSIEAYEWLKAHGATIGATYYWRELRDICVKYSPYMLREMIEYYSDELNTPRRYNGTGAPTLGTLFITSAMNAENYASFRVLAESKKIGRKQWILALQGEGTEWGVAHAFGWLWKEDYVALQKLDIWQNCVTVCVANAIVAQRVGAVCKRGLPNELWLIILNLM